MPDKSPGQIAYEAYRAELFTSPGIPYGELEGQTRAAWEAAARAAIAACAERRLFEHLDALERSDANG